MIINMNKELVKYIETTIFPKYADGSGHSLGHIKYVIERSLKFAEQVPEANKDICYTVAAYHDLERLLDDDYHEKISAAFVRIDEKLKEFFTDEEIDIIAEAVEDHRASSKHEPRSIYGKIVSSADRTTSADEMVLRTVETHSYWYPDLSLDEILESARKHVLEKYGKDGYALKKMYFDDPDFVKCCEEIVEIVDNPDKFKARYLELKDAK